MHSHLNGVCITHHGPPLQDIRLLLVISNFGQLMNSLIPSMINQLESAFGVTIEDDRQASFTISSSNPPPTDNHSLQTLMTVVRELDTTLFDGYVKPKTTVATGIIRDGILNSNMDWYETPQPTGTIMSFVCFPSITNYSRNSTLHV